ncbi:MAG: type II secretion system protein [Aromatoleum sp.]|jgi:type II secretory pathway pseudopilin PulG|uniref:type II secretion system protein n=1 Tax=Aromatoleum sp. TaxID=2307007 RepID=UPI002895A593|nr:type II secretion system protein [Aromatoleum sp.]MDT3672249.1 type II secretion system protein [Aromatoleum sp.]
MGAPVAAACSRRRASRSVQSGFTYLLVLFLVAALGVFAAQTGVVWHHATQREREAELLAIGVEFARALARYRDASPDGVLPGSLQPLVEDRRSGVPVRHLRRIYRDPFTGETNWGLEKAAGQITGVYSLARGTPIRERDLPPELAGAKDGAKKYSEWIFRPAVRSAEEGGGGEVPNGLPPNAAGPGAPSPLPR